MGSASNDAWFPAESVAVTCTGYAPARFGTPHDSVFQPPLTLTRFDGPAPVTTETVAGFETQNVSEPSDEGASWNAGGCFS